MAALRIGDIWITALSDGQVHLSPDYFGGVDWEHHRDLLSPAGTIDLPIGCFLIATAGRLVLVDAGLGPRTLDWGSGGDLPAALERAGIARAAIETVVCTHVHIDHIGWLATDQGPFFQNATVRLGLADWTLALSGAKESPGRQMIEAVEAAGRFVPIDGDRVEVAPGVTAIATPGHTPGHLSIVVSAGRERAILLGDAVTCPRQLEEPDWQNMTDVDPALAHRTREALWRDLAGRRDVAVAAHFPGLAFGRVLRTERAYRLVVPDLPFTSLDAGPAEPPTSA